MKFRTKKLQWNKYCRIVCMALLVVYFVFVATQSNVFRGEMFDQLSMEHDKTDVIENGWEEKIEFRAGYKDVTHLEMSVNNPMGGTAKGTMRYWITDGDEKTVWKQDIPMSRMTPAKFHRGIKGTIVEINQSLKKGEKYNLHLKSIGGSSDQKITLRSQTITVYYQGFNQMKYIMLLGMTFALIILIVIPNKLSEKWNQRLSQVMFVVTPFYCYMLMERFNLINIRLIKIQYSFLNLLVYGILLLFFYMITNRTRWAAILTVLCTSGLGLANFFVTTYRGSSLMPVDFATIGTAANVATEYQYEINSAILWNGIFILAFIFINLRLQCSKGMKGKKRFISIGMFIVVFAIGVSTFGSSNFLRRIGVRIKVWNPTVSCNKYGYATVFASSIRFLVVEKPKGYSTEKVNQIMEPYVKRSLRENEKVSGKTPNVIAIMDEAFSDLNVLGDFKTNKDAMPFIRSLKKNTIKGTMYMSSYGGQTANSEFEFLTGNTMAFLPGGSVAYQYQVKDKLGGLTSTLKQQGYQGNIALHPFISNGYNREKVYPLLGFSEYLSREDFEQPERCRNYITDQEDFDKIIAEYEKSKMKSGAPFYLFNVTIQNHGGYEKDFNNFKQEIRIIDSNTNNYVNRYLSLVKKTDQAFEKLVQYFEKIDEPTVIVFFGDHQPKLPDSFYNGVMNKKDSSTIENEQKKYKVPFVIWANYDIKSEEVEAISPNYLSSKVIEVAKVRKTPYQTYLQELYKEYPVITGSIYMDSKFSLHSIGNLQDLPEKLREYQMVQYYHMFEKDDRNDSFFYLNESGG